MAVLNKNFATTYDSSASIQSGQSTYRVVGASAQSVETRTILLVSRPANSNQAKLEESDPLTLGYILLAEDQEEIDVASQRRINRGRFPGRRIAD